MNASSWRKAVDLVAQGTQANQQVQAAATTDSSQLESFPLSTLSADDSSPPQVNYGTEQPLAASTPRANLTSTRETQATDTYRQIIPGMSEHLYPTLIADGSLTTPAADNCSTLQNQITSEIDKYLQEAAEKHERDDNYYDGWHVASNTSSPQQEANFLEQDDNAGSDEEENEASVPESNGQDTGTHYGSHPGHDIQPQDELETIPEEEPQMEEKQDIVDQDTVVFTPDESKEEPFNTAIDDTSDDPTIVMGKPVTTAFISDDVHIPTEKVSCLQVTRQLQEFLNHFPPESIEKAFEQIYQILQVLDAYLIDNPQQHQYCMSPDSECISLITYTTKLEIDLCYFPAIWAVLSILLDTKSNELQYVKNLQQVVNNYYDKCPMEVMSRLEQQTSDIMNVMYDSVTNDNFDRVSDDIDRVSGAVDNDSNETHTDNRQIPYDTDNDNDTATGEMKYERNMTNELKDIGTNDMVLYERDDKTHMQSNNGQYRNEMYKRAESMIPQLDGTFNVPDNSDTDSHSYLDLAGTNIILYRTRGQKQRYEENEMANANRRSAHTEYIKPNTNHKKKHTKTKGTRW